MFKVWLSWAESNRDKLGYLQINGGREFISSALKNFCNESGINIEYAAPYMHKENSIANQY